MSTAEPAPAPGPSRLPTISTEEDEAEMEAGIVINGAGGASSSAPPNGGGEINGNGMEVDGVKPEGEGEEGEEKKVDPNAIPDDACETLYLQNLNEKVQIPVMKQTLATLFKPYRPLLPITAHRNARMRGQAFVSFADIETANRARRDVNEFPLYGKAMQVSFAKRRADVAVEKMEGEEGLEEHKKVRLAEKKIKRRDNPLRRKALAKLRAEQGPDASPQLAKKPRLQMPDEYLPPNNVLFIQNLPEGTTADDLREVFELHPGLVEIRTIPAKKDIAFIEFSSEEAATIAKDALHNFKIDGETKMKVTYAKK